MTTPTRWLPDSALLTMDVLRAVGIDCVDQMPRAGSMRYPLVYARRVPGSGPVHPRFLDSATISVLCFATDRTQALDLAASCAVALYEAWEQQKYYAHGSISSYDDTSGQTPLSTPEDNAPEGEVVVQSTFRLGMCPPPAIA